jgi:hypothetical protein
MASPKNNPVQTPAEQQEEQRKLRRLQLVLNMTLSVLRQDPHLTLAQAHAMIANCKSAALAMFPGKESTFDLLYAPRLQRALDERFPLAD